MINNIDRAKCIGCGTCTEVCMKDVLAWESETSKRPVIKYQDDCQTCYDCELMCPAGAIWVFPAQRPKTVYAW